MGRVTSVVFSPSDRKHFASGSWGNTFCIWDVGRRKLAVGSLTGREDSVNAKVYSLDGTRLISSSIDTTVHIWNPEFGDALSTLNSHSGSVYSVAYSLCRSRIVSGVFDNTILVWNAQSNQVVCGPITGHKNVLTLVRFSPDGKRTLLGSYDNTTLVWDETSGKSLFPPLSAHTVTIYSIYFFPDGRQFVTGSKDEAIRTWTLHTILNDTNWELRNDNWVVGENGRLMMWIPKDLHTPL
ncbi:WD40 domain containing protein [Pyrrhoderma noxium]|uniref:WD40 domain containing protein n=1 Tax=Pyrrhoderma noxium TaxID=2282107 RepID=A0A286UTT9_9AGAM|nr:WD40 domain containing protein [Pyrrhoderma noxium]